MKAIFTTLLLHLLQTLLRRLRTLPLPVMIPPLDSLPHPLHQMTKKTILPCQTSDDESAEKEKHTVSVLDGDSR